MRPVVSATSTRISLITPAVAAPVVATVMAVVVSIVVTAVVAPIAAVLLLAIAAALISVLMALLIGILLIGMLLLLGIIWRRRRALACFRRSRRLGRSGQLRVIVSTAVHIAGRPGSIVALGFGWCFKGCC